MPIIHVSRLFLFAPSTSALKPNKLADATPLNLDGVRYFMSSTEDILSPYFASNPPVEKAHLRSYPHSQNLILLAGQSVLETGGKLQCHLHTLNFHQNFLL